MKRKIKKEEFDALPDAIKEHYLEKNGEYVLDIEGDEDTGALKRAKIREQERRKELEKEAQELREKLEKIETDDAYRRGDIEKLQKGWDAERAKIEQQYKADLDAKRQYIQKTLVDNVALKFANEHFLKPNLILPHIKSRLQAVGIDENDPKTVILDSTGKPSDMDLEALRKEFIDNAEFSDIMIGSKATGGGTSRNRTVQKASGSNGGSDKIELSKLSNTELIEYMKNTQQ